MSAFRLFKVYYVPGQDTVTLAVQAQDGPFRGKILDLYCTQQELTARCPEDRVTWSDAECIAEVTAQLEAHGGQLAA